MAARAGAGRRPRQKTYEVTVVRILTLSTTVEVKAGSEDEAEEMAQTQVQHAPMTWKVDDEYAWQEESDDIGIDRIEQV